MYFRKHFPTIEEEYEKFNNECVSNPKVQRKIIIKLADLHDSLVEIVNAINHCFSIQIMSAFLGIVLNNIFSTFAVYRVTVRKDYSSFYQACVQYAWNIYFFIYAIVIIIFASMLTKTAKYSAVLVHKAINYCRDDSVIEYVGIIILLSQHIILFQFHIFKLKMFSKIQNRKLIK